MTDITDLKQRYEKVKEFVPAKEQEKIESLRVKYEEGHQFCGYGHSLLGAAARGWRIKALIAVEVALECEGWAAAYGGRRIDAAYLEVSMVLDRLIEAAIYAGVDTEEIKRILKRQLEQTDSGSMDNRAKYITEGRGLRRS